MSEPLSTRPPARSATLGGVGVILVTGVFTLLVGGALLVLARGYGFRMEGVDYGLLALVVAITVGGGTALARFVRLHGDEIGEARFDTSKADEEG